MPGKGRKVSWHYYKATTDCKHWDDNFELINGNYNVICRENQPNARMINEVKKSVVDYKSELSALRKKTLNINRSVCNLDEVISSIQASSDSG